MRVLLDECLPRNLKLHLSSHEARTVPEMGWAGRTNGELLALASGQFEVFRTVDRGFEYQQNFLGTSLAIISLSLVSKSNRLEDLQPLMRKVVVALPTLQPGTITQIRG
jgi:predicted nuclease of predicted toxin-antitoxin system